MSQPASAYFIEDRHDPNETHTLAVLVQNEPGVLARVIGLFSGRGYNIESLTVSETESQKHLSRITIVTTGTPMVIEQIKHQLDRMVPVYRVVDMTQTGRAIERELAMVKVRGQGEHRVEALRRHHGKFCVRDHRQYRQDQSVYRSDAPARPGRGVPDRCCRDWPRA
jgi:acetolactate synthase-1/3 small subunit